MPHEIEYRGSYRYADADALESALARARCELEAAGVQVPHVRFFVSGSSELVINASVSEVGRERRAVANALLVLASKAVEGAVEAHRRT